MTEYEALCAAIGLLTQEAPLQRRGIIADHDDQEAYRSDALERLESLREMFEPYPGDDPEEAKKRTPHPCVCSNCKYTFARMFAPAPLNRVAEQAIRGSVCPRCYATEGILILWDKADLPMSFTAKITSMTTGANKLTFIAKTEGSRKNIENAEAALKKGKFVTITTMPGS